MYPIVLPDSRTLALPTRWGEVTLGQAARLAELPDGADIYSFLSVLLNLSPLEVMNLPAAFVNEQVLPVLSFSADEMPGFSGLEMPDTITLPGEPPRTLPVLSSLDVVSFGQATDLGALLQDTTLPVSQKRIRALAIVLYPAYHGTAEYDADAKDAFGDQVCSQAILEEALPITDFFLPTTTAFAAGTPPSSSASPSAATSTPPASKPSWRNGMRWLWSTRWPVVTKPAGPTSSASAGAR
jgi:hypothetical protein